MAKILTHIEFIEKWADKCRLSEKTMKKVYQNMEEIIKEEVRVNGSFRLRNIGLIYVKVVGGYDAPIPNPLGGLKQTEFITVRNVPKFKFSDNFKDYVSGHAGITKEYKKRVKTGTLTKQDKKLKRKLQEEKNATVRGMLKQKKKTGEDFKEIQKSKKKKR